jgi:hypothetical protein
MAQQETPSSFTVRDAVLIIFAVLAILLFSFYGKAQSPGLSRWALGRPSLVIDMPGDPAGGNVAWAERPIYSIFPNAWSAEGSGVRIEVARIYTAKDPAALLAEVGQKVNTPMTPRGRGDLSGREFVNFMNATRMAAVIGKDEGVFGGASWVVMATYKDQAGQELAGAIFDSIKVEREGNRHWALRSLGPTFLAAELPFELLQQKRSSDNGSLARYESSFDGMDIKVTNQSPGEGMVFEREATLKDIAEGERSLPGVTNFTSIRDKYKLGTREGDIITKNFKRGYRSYRAYEIVFIEKRSALTVSIQIDPARADHQATTERILRSLKTTQNTIYGWKTYAVGDQGLYVDLPVAPTAPRQMNSVTIYESNTPLAMVEMRELEVGYPSAHNPDFSAKQYFEMQQALNSKANFQLQSIDKLLIDGMEARLVKATWQNGKETNFRQILTIYGYQTQWIIDMLASKETAEYMERVMQSVRVKVNFPPATVRQSFGTMGVSFLVGDQRLEPQIKQDPADPDFTREESANAQYGNSILTVYEMNFKTQTPGINDERGKFFMDSFLSGLSKAAGITLSAKQRDSFPVNIDGVEGRHIIYDVTASVMKPGAVIQADFVMLGQDKKLWTAIVITNYEGGLSARYNRARILNSLRVGM